MKYLKLLVHRLLPFFPFIVLAIALLVVIYHIKVYW
jgi:hypothetical protein